MLRVAPALATLATGCNAVFGLVGTDFELPLDAATVADIDGDGFDRELDNCPHIGNDQQDEDRDMVGDACDPHPTEPGDRLVELELFDGSPSNWNTAGWDIAIGGATSPPPSGTNAVLSLRNAVPVLHPELQLGFEFVDLGPEQMDNAVRVLLGAPASGGRIGLADQVHADGMSTMTLIIADLPGEARHVPQVAVDTRYALRFSRGAEAAWRLDTEQFVGYDEVDFVFDVAPDIVVQQMQIRVHYIALYDRTP